MMNTFPQFGRLPPELRQMIWDLAIRPDCMGAHYFGCCNGFLDMNDVDANHLVFTGTTQRACHLTAPKCHARSTETDDELTVPSWTEKNPSTYLIDAGLWTACKESRHVIRRRFRIDSWDEYRNDPDREWHALNSRCMPATGYFRDDQSRKRFFTIFPHRDLIIIQPHCLYTFNLEHLNTMCPIGSTRHGFDGLLNVALEYDPRWGATVQETPENEVGKLPIIEFFVDMAFKRHAVDTIWLVDDAIKRPSLTFASDEIKAMFEKEEATKPKPLIFSHPGRQFVEVPADPWSALIWKQTHDRGPGKGTSCRRFVDAVEREVRNTVRLWQRQIQGVEANNVDTNRFLETLASFGVLACEDA